MVCSEAACLLQARTQPLQHAMAPKGNPLLGNIQRVNGVFRIAWKCDVLDDVPAHEQLPMQRESRPGLHISWAAATCLTLQ